jgi:hypothetical protein
MNIKKIIQLLNLQNGDRFLNIYDIIFLKNMKTNVVNADGLK